MDTLPSLPDLTPDDRVWRLVWFGDCAYPAQVRRYAQPSLRAVFSPLLESLDPESADRHYQRDAWVPVSMLPILVVATFGSMAGRSTPLSPLAGSSFERFLAVIESIASVK